MSVSDELIKEFSGRMCRAHCTFFRADAELVNVPRPGAKKETTMGIGNRGRIEVDTIDRHADADAGTMV